jgi:hypothetical protein
MRSIFNARYYQGRARRYAAEARECLNKALKSVPTSSYWMAEAVHYQKHAAIVAHWARVEMGIE